MVLSNEKSDTSTTVCKPSCVQTVPISHLGQDVGQTGVIEAGFRRELPHTDQLQQISLHLAHLQADVAVQRQNLQQHVISPHCYPGALESPYVL